MTLLSEQFEQPHEKRPLAAYPLHGLGYSCRQMGSVCFQQLGQCLC